ncbi:MAG TPA: fumarylacetoacetate hydrolase family protein [Steroidobacteraceae bacterium]|nr:fumarylacetoacetate hydrolase family protein [Steroidobacteraceae bacterium]
MLSEEECARCADEMLCAAVLRRPATRPSRTFPDITFQDACRIQDLWAQMRLTRGGKLLGYKVGLTSAAARQALRAAEPSCGRIFEEDVHSPAEHIPADRFLKPSLEVELAFIVHEALEGPELRSEDVLRIPHEVVPAFEIVDRRTELPRTLADTIADNAAFGGLILGRQALHADVDLSRVGATLFRNGTIEDTGLAAAVMGHPAAAVAWLANKLHATGATLQKGQIVLTGAFLRPIDVRRGDRIAADYQPGGTLEALFV